MLLFLTLLNIMSLSYIEYQLFNKFECKRALLVTLAISVLTFIPAFYFSDYNMLNRYYIFIGGSISFILASFLYREDKRIRMLSSGIWLLYGIISETVMVIVSLIITNGINYETVISQYGIYPAIAITAIISIAVILFKTRFINSDIDLDYEDLDLIFRVMFLLFIVEAYLNNNQELSRHSVLVFILELLYLLASAFTMIRKHLEKEKQQKLELEIMNHEKIAEEKIMTARKETQQLRHDIRHLISVITSDKYNSDEIEKMVENYKDMNETVLPVVTISEPVNYVLNSKREEAVKQGIDLVSSINIIEDIKMDNSDLVLLLSNILDNAIKHIGQEKKIRFEIFQKNHITVIRCSNSIDMKKQNIIKEGHGFGIPTIKTITEKYNGTFDINRSDTVFEITVGLTA